MIRRTVWTVCVGLLMVCPAAFPANYPAPGTEITDQHPLFIFCLEDGADTAPTAFAEAAVAQWTALNDSLRPYAVLGIRHTAGGEARWDWLEQVLPTLQEAGVPVVVRIGNDDPRSWMPLARLEALLRQHTAVRGVEAAGLRFNVYPAPGEADSPATDKVAWLADAMDLAARYSRLFHLTLGGLDWLRVMSNRECAPLYEAIKACREHVIATGHYQGAHALARNTALQGLWLEGAVAQWGIGADGNWYAEAGYRGPGIFGAGGTLEELPRGIFRAMILNGAMMGAKVYAFGPPESLWMGPQRQHWDDEIRPTLESILRLGLIAREDFVRRRTRLAYQLNEAANPPDFRFNLRDVDSVLGEGLLMRAAYGMERPGQVWELVPNRGDNYFVPILSAHATDEARAPFARVVRPGEAATVDEWRSLLDQYAVAPLAPGAEAFVTTVGRGVFVMNTRENVRQSQQFSLPGVPAPVRNVEARRVGGSVALSWPFREGDVSYSVYRRETEDGRFTLLTLGLEERQYVDEGVFPEAAAPASTVSSEKTAGLEVVVAAELPSAPDGPTVAYAVTALTNETEPYSGTVDYGEHLALSVVESRIAEQVVLHPLLGQAVSQPMASASDDLPPGDMLDGLAAVAPEHLDVARAIAGRIEEWDRAYRAEDLNGVLDLYASAYEDPQGWSFQYARRAYQWLFERYETPRMTRQVRRWEFRRLEDAGEVSLLLYCRLGAAAVSSPDGRVADVPIAIPRTETAEVWVTWAQREGLWRIVRTNPALPNLRDLLSYSAGPYDNFPLGPDWLD